MPLPYTDLVSAHLEQDENASNKKVRRMGSTNFAAGATGSRGITGPSTVPREPLGPIVRTGPSPVRVGRLRQH